MTRGRLLQGNAKLGSQQIPARAKLSDAPAGARLAIEDLRADNDNGEPAVLLVNEDLDEISELADRMVVGRHVAGH